MQKAQQRLEGILKKCKASNIPMCDLEQLEVVQKVFEKQKLQHMKIILCIFVITIVVCSFIFVFGESKCLIKMPFDSTKMFREPEDCKMCRNVHEIDKVEKISHADFEDLYVSNAIPVVITDATKSWPALATFSFEFFKQLYHNTSRKESDTSECQFFPYKTEFTSLKEALNMSNKRSRLEPGTQPWYIGWSNCNDEASNILRQHYTKPYFLSESLENLALDWIFMGGPGYGAHMHVDNVHYPSWQAQLRGQKVWKLAPPPECLYQCRELQVTLLAGETIVVDTNRWYHQTLVLPGDISITIGAEFD